MYTEEFEYCCGALIICDFETPFYPFESKKEKKEWEIEIAEEIQNHEDDNANNIGLLTAIVNDKQLPFMAPVFRKLKWKKVSAVTNPGHDNISTCYLYIKELTPVKVKTKPKKHKAK